MIGLGLFVLTVGLVAGIVVGGGILAAVWIVLVATVRTWVLAEAN